MIIELAIGIATFIEVSYAILFSFAPVIFFVISAITSYESRSHMRTSFVMQVMFMLYERGPVRFLAMAISIAILKLLSSPTPRQKPTKSLFRLVCFSFSHAVSFTTPNTSAECHKNTFSFADAMLLLFTIFKRV